MDRDIPERIVCAANRAHGAIIMGLRHNDSFMMDGIKRVLALEPSEYRRQWMRDFLATSAQGFVTNRGRWVDRAEAYIIASNQLQLVRKTGGLDNKTLYSEDVY